MSDSNNLNPSQLNGTDADDSIVGGATDDSIATLGGNDHLNGGEGSDVLDGGADNDLAAGDTVGSEWQLVDGRWVYNPDKIWAGDHDGPRDNVDYNDTIQTGSGDDVLLGNWGNDSMLAGAGNDIINAGTGADSAFGGSGDDIINLEQGNDLGYGGVGADTVNAGDGNDVVYGDTGGQNLLAENETGSRATSLDQHAAGGHWTVSEEAGVDSMTQSVSTQAGESYTLTFDLAANTAGGANSGTVEVLWNGEVVGTVSTTSGVYETHSIEIPGTGGEGDLTFNVVQPQEVYEGPEIDISGPVHSYEKVVEIGGEPVTVDAFAPGQANLYQVIDGNLKIFDTVTEEYSDVGTDPGFKINAVGFNVEDDMIYGIAKSPGHDALGNEISVPDVVMMDASGNAYRVGDAPYGDYVGDFDGDGNLVTFHSSLDRLTLIDVDNLDANGDPVSTTYDLDNSVFKGRIYDIAYNSEEDMFYAVESPGVNGGNGTLHRIDLSEVSQGGDPIIESIPISGTLYGDDMAAGMAKGAYGAVFLDGDGNLFYGLNKGDHDLDSSTAVEGGIFQVHADFGAGTAYSEFRAEAQTTGSNDGTVDPRSVDPFAVTDTEATVLIREPSLASNAGGNDDLRGGDGNDTMFGEVGDDKLHGGTGDDQLDGGVGDDKLLGGEGDDALIGGSGNDSLLGGSGNDDLDGGAGRDYVNAGSGDDTISGGDGNDKIVGGTGSDVISGGAGDDHLWGGNWSGDNASDTFLVAKGGGKDMIHDFETDHDVLDLSAYGLEFSDLQGLMQDQGWATTIDLSGVEGGSPGDKLILKSVDSDDLDESNFLL